MVKNNEFFILGKKLKVSSEVYPTVRNIFFARYQHFRKLYSYEEYDSWIKNFPKAKEELRFGESYNADIFFIPDVETVTTEDCIKFAEQYSDSFVGIQGVAGKWRKTKKWEKVKNWKRFRRWNDPTKWIDSKGDLWDPKVFANRGKKFEFNLGIFNFDLCARNYLIIFYQLDKAN